MVNSFNLYSIQLDINQHKGNVNYIILKFSILLSDTQLIVAHIFSSALIETSNMKI